MTERVARGRCTHARVSPVHYVTGAQQRGGVNDGVPHGTRSVEVWELTDQMAGQETAVRTTNHGQALGVQGVVCLQRSDHGSLQENAQVNLRVCG